MEQFLIQKKAAILERWFQLILDGYPADTSRFLKQESDRFSNPVGYTISREIEVIYDEMLREMRYETLSASLDNIIRIIAVQESSPSRAVSFIFQLKKAVRDELDSEIKKGQLLEDLYRLELKIDELALMAMDIYARCREKIYEIRVKEAKAEAEQLARLLERTNLSYMRLDRGKGFGDKMK